MHTHSGPGGRIVPDQGSPDNDTGPEAVWNRDHGSLAADNSDPASVRDQGSPNGDPDMHDHDYGALADDDSDSVGVQDQGSPDGNPGPEDAHDEVHGSLAADDDDEFRPPDWECFPTPNVVVADKIGWLQSLMERPDSAQYRKNLQAANETVRLGVSFTAYQVIADGKLINGDEWRPHMGPFFMPCPS